MVRLYGTHAPLCQFPRWCDLAQPDRPLRADAARNRARVLEVAYETFAAEGLVGADRRDRPSRRRRRRHGLSALPHQGGPVPGGDRRTESGTSSTRADALAEGQDPGKRCSSSFARWCCSSARPTTAWPTRWPARGSTSRLSPPETEAAFLGLLGDLLEAAQKAGTVRGDVDVAEVKALLPGAYAMQAASPDAAETGHRGGLRRPAGLRRRPCTRPGRVLEMTLALATSEC